MAGWKGSSLIVLAAGCFVAAGVLAWQEMQSGIGERLVKIDVEVPPDPVAGEVSPMTMAVKNDNRSDIRIVGMGFC